MKNKLFNLRPRTQKKLAYIQLKNEITKQGTNFSTHDILHDKCQWADIVFLGKNKSIYNATIFTTQCAWYDLINEKAWEALYAKTTPEDKFFEIVELEGYTSNSKMSGPTTISDPSMKSLGGKTASQFLDDAKKEISQDKTITVNESFKLLKGFFYGIGLDMVIHTPHLTQDSITKAIEKFISLGEKNWNGQESYNFTYEENSNFTTNAISLD